MSNPYRNLQAFEREIRMRNMIEDAVVTRYKQRGGDKLDERIAILDEVNATSMLCRKSEHERMLKNPEATREKGERPLVTVSETRLYITKTEHLVARRNEELAFSRSQIMTAIEHAKPTDEKTLRVTLDLELRTISEETRKALEEMHQEIHQDEIQSAESLKPVAELLLAVPNEEHKAALMEAFRVGDQEQFGKYFDLQSEEWRNKWNATAAQINAQRK